MQAFAALQTQNTRSLCFTDCSCNGPLPVPLLALEDASRVQRRENHATGKDYVEDYSAPAIPTSLLLHKDPVDPKTWPSHSHSPVRTAQEKVC